MPMLNATQNPLVYLCAKIFLCIFYAHIHIINTFSYSFFCSAFFFFFCFSDIFFMKTQQNGNNAVLIAHQANKIPKLRPILECKSTSVDRDTSTTGRKACN